jgi:general nucleoside transport system permease protein
MSAAAAVTVAPVLRALRPILRSRVGVVAASFVVVGVLMLAFGANPLRIYAEMSKGAFGSVNAVAETLIYTTPILLTGLAAIVCFRCGMWNIGAEGQLYLGAIAAVGLGFNKLGLPDPMVLPAMVIGAATAGALWAAVPAILKVRFGANEVIVTIMMNFIALILATWLISGPWASGSTPVTKPIVEAGHLPILIPETRLHVNLIGALAVAAILWVVLNRTVLGYEIRAIGFNPRAARVAGMPVERVIVVSFLISGAVAGLAGFNEVAGIHHNLPDHISPGFGFTGIAVALLANLDPAWAVISAIFIGALNVGADSMQRATGVPVALVWVIEGLILLTLLASGALRRP